MLTCAQKQTPNMTRPPRMEGFWRCCGGGKDCGREVNKSKDGETCPDCSHKKCPSCEKIRQPSPLQDELSCQHQDVGYFHPADFAHEPATMMASNRMPSTCKDGLPPMQYESSSHLVEHLRRPRPSMRGWWHCCQCGDNVNLEINSWTCPACNHRKCNYDCYIHQS